MRRAAADAIEEGVEAPGRAGSILEVLMGPGMSNKAGTGGGVEGVAVAVAVAVAGAVARAFWGVFLHPPHAQCSVQVLPSKCSDSPALHVHTR